VSSGVNRFPKSIECRRSLVWFKRYYWGSELPFDDTPRLGSNAFSLERRMLAPPVWATWHAVQLSGAHVASTRTRRSAGSGRAGVWDSPSRCKLSAERKSTGYRDCPRVNGLAARSPRRLGSRARKGESATRRDVESVLRQRRRRCGGIDLRRSMRLVLAPSRISMNGCERE
jgi:hypothetical protein